MSNYTGGARNHAKHRKHEPGSRTPFMSNGIATTRPSEISNVPLAPHFDLKHATNASEKPRTPLQVCGKIDAVSMSEISDIVGQRGPRAFLPPPETLGDPEDKRTRVLERLKYPSFISLPPVKPRSPVAIPISLKRPRNHVGPTDSLPQPETKQRKLAVSPGPSEASGLETKTTTQNVPHQDRQISCTNDIEGGQNEDQGIGSPITPWLSLSAYEEEIDSSPPTPPGSLPEIDGPDCFFSDGEDLALPDDSVSSNPFLVTRIIPPLSKGSPERAEDPVMQHSQLLQGYDGFSPCAMDVGDALSDAVSGACPAFPAMEHFRLPGERCGVGLQLKRWVCDGLPLENDPALLSLRYSTDSEEEDGEKQTSIGWLEYPYDDHLMEECHTAAQDDLTDLPIAVSDEEEASSTVQRSDEWPLECVVDAEEPTNTVIEHGQGGTVTDGHVDERLPIGGSLSEELYDWGTEGEVVYITPAPAEDEEVFVLAPNLFE